jgi:soluble lytic murein transglycosylase-like protein
MRWDPEVLAAVKRWAPVYGVTIDPALVHAIIQKESSHGSLLVTAEPGNRFSYGPMMVLDSTAKELGATMPSSLTQPAIGISYGVRYLAKQLRRYGSRATDAIAAYNAGTARKDAQGRYVNTKGVPVVQAYVDKVLGYWNSYKGQVTAAAPVAALAIAAAALLWFAARRRRAA